MKLTIKTDYIQFRFYTKHVAKMTKDPGCSQVCYNFILLWGMEIYKCDHQVTALASSKGTALSSSVIQVHMRWQYFKPRLSLLS